MSKKDLIYRMEKEIRVYTEADIEELVQAFIQRNLPKSAWTHAAHLIVALWHLTQYSVDEATCLLRARIIHYNEAVGTENSGNSGYHETLTLFWIWVITEYLAKQEGDLEELVNAFIRSKYADRQLAIRFYNKSTIFSSGARARWVEPDLRPLDFNVI